MNQKNYDLYRTLKSKNGRDEYLEKIFDAEETVYDMTPITLKLLKYNGILENVTRKLFSEQATINVDLFMLFEVDQNKKIGNILFYENYFSNSTSYDEETEIPNHICVIDYYRLKKH